MFSCDLTLTDRIGDDTSSLPLREKLSRGEETGLEESSGRSRRETMYDRRRNDGNESPVWLRNGNLVAISRLRLLHDGKLSDD